MKLFKALFEGRRKKSTESILVTNFHKLNDSHLNYDNCVIPLPMPAHKCSFVTQFYKLIFLDAQLSTN